MTSWVHKILRPQEVIQYFLGFLARAHSKNVEGQDLHLKECPSEFNGGQHCAIESPRSQDLRAQGSPSVKENQEIKVSLIVTKPFNCLLSFLNLFVKIARYKLRSRHHITHSVWQVRGSVLQHAGSITILIFLWNRPVPAYAFMLGNGRLPKFITKQT